MPSLTQKAGIVSTTVKESQHYINLATTFQFSSSPYWISGVARPTYRKLVMWVCNSSNSKHQLSLSTDSDSPYSNTMNLQSQHTEFINVSNLDNTRQATTWLVKVVNKTRQRYSNEKIPLPQASDLHVLYCITEHKVPAMSHIRRFIKQKTSLQCALWTL